MLKFFKIIYFYYNMCYSKKISLISFLFGIITSIGLISFGNKKSFYSNLSIGIFYIFVSFMQLVEYFIWSDILCINGLNKLGSLIGPILNHIQPVIFFILLYIFVKPKIIIPINIIIICNILYILYIIYKYYYYVKDKDNLCVGVNNEGHLEWSWKQNYYYIFYFIINFIIIINYYQNTNILISFITSYLFLLISIFKFKKNIGEFWCLMVTGVPLIVLIIQKIFDIKK